MTDYEKDPKVADWLKRANAELKPMIADSVHTIALWDGHYDAKQAVELGFMILMDKPLILAVTPGSEIPEHLRRVADEIVEYDFRDKEGSQARLEAALDRITEREKE